MALSRYKLGELIVPHSEKCGIANLTPYQVSGVNREKEFFEPSHQVGEDTSKYQVVPPKYFACNLMHVGRDCVLPVAWNHSGNVKYVSPAYTVFSLKQNYGVLDEYLFMLLKSEEKDRYFWFHADASVRDGMSWQNFCDVEICVPDLSTQQKYVDIYKGMVANQQCYERGLEDLKLVCDAYIEDLRRKIPCEKIGAYISEINERNSFLQIENVQGVNSSSNFGKTKADTMGLDFRNYKIVKKGQFAYNPSRINLGSIALLSTGDCIVSPMYIVFEISNIKKILPEYLMLWLRRKQFQRSTFFFATGSVRDSFNFDLMGEVKIPIPTLSIQKSIVDIYNVYTERKRINEQLKSQIKNICPILIRGSLEENLDKERGKNYEF